MHIFVYTNNGAFTGDSIFIIKMVGFVYWQMANSTYFIIYVLYIVCYNYVFSMQLLCDSFSESVFFFQFIYFSVLLIPILIFF